jgi:DNA-binding FadR family transcriptional regulator
VASEIRRYVEQERLKPGDRIGTEQELATALGVSRPTLREGLRLLAGSQLIRSSKGRGGGIFVASTANEGIGRNLSDSIATMLATESVSLGELLEARVVLEVPIAGLAAAAATQDTVAALEAAVERASKSEPGQQVFNAADYAFHDALAGAELAMRQHLEYLVDVLRKTDARRG